ncbi:MAG: hypothetical protein HN820_01625 [Candidatus Marinimicrobia bacterium]|jgi:hypothetical protein|nr:hypothetical protein [Candidatus Neomarinimicrobiota bacterium]MBT5955996.1 hypothetical protein [Candidatus Neomarinimicrobiota bacterium]MBT6870433.1 hypothetical protein [Candidatus Neomarinimicrobiota bacterium]MBT7376835.1 hypothetical protein [Candidatus Neomarinimicrobiota bacterium]
MNKFISIVIFFSMALSFDFGPNVHVAMDDYDQKFPDIHVDENGVIHTVWVRVLGNSKNIYYSKSIDNGVSFSEPMRVNSESNHIVAYVGTGPRVRSYGDNVYVLWPDSRDGYNNTSIYLNTSTDGGMNWQDEVMVSNQPHFQLYSEMEVDGQGYLHIIYYNFGNSLQFLNVRYAKMQLESMMLYESIPLGITSEEAESCDCCAPDMSVTVDGDVYVAYRNNMSNIRDHYIVKKSANSAEFDAPYLMAEMNHYISYCPSSGPSIAFEGDQLIAGFMSGNTTSSYVVTANSNDLSFTPPVNVNEANSSSTQQNYPSVALMNGIGHVAWVDFATGGGDIHYANIEVGTNNLFDSQIINDDSGNAMQTNPIIKNHNGNIYCVWADDRGSDYQVFFASTNSFDITSGDINQDDVIDILDIVSLVNFILGTDSPDIIEEMAADLDGNGVLNILDIIQIINIIME